MAHFTEVHLNDAKSEEFLLSRGWHLHQHCGTASAWIHRQCLVYFDVNTIVRDDATLYRLLFDQAYDQGREQGKQDALRVINQNLTYLVFPPKPPTKEPTVSYGLYGLGKH